MEFFVDVAQVFVGDMGVNLGGAYVGVAKKGLDRTQIGAIAKQIGSEEVAHGMRCHSFRDAGTGGTQLYYSLYRSAG